MKRKIFAWILILCLGAGWFPGLSPLSMVAMAEGDEDFVTGVTLDQTTLALAVGADPVALIATVEPAGLNVTVAWSSDNPRVATVDEEGNVTALRTGTAEITARVGNFSVSCTVTAIVPVTSVTLNKTELFLSVGGATAALTAKIMPASATDKTVAWTSSNEDVASVSGNGLNATITSGTRSGSATITATAGDLSAECEVLVLIPPETVTLSKTELSLNTGESEVLDVTVRPANTTDQTVTWTTSAAKVATVDENGRVTAVGGGTAVITASVGMRDAGGIQTAQCAVTVIVPVSEITLNTTDLSVEVDGKGVLRATCKPSNATDKTIVWSSSDPSVATVDATGQVSGLKAGRAVITASCGGQTADCTVTVVIPVSGITLNQTQLSLLVGASSALRATVSPSNATDKTVTWTSSAPRVATVDEAGRVSGVSGGTATITARAGSQSVTCEVTVTVLLTSLTLNKNTLTLDVGKTDTTLKATLAPANVTDKTVVWTSSDERIASVEGNGLSARVTALAGGSVTITATSGSGSAAKSATCALTVTIPPAGVQLDHTTLSLNAGQNATLHATVTPSNATNKAVTWTSSAAKVAAVDAEGKVTAVSGGTAVITARAGTASATCTVTVTVPVESVTLSKSTLSLGEGKIETLTATVLPANATDKTVTWASSNEEVATVTAGRITAIQAGETTITARAGDKSAVCALTVTILARSIQLSQSTLELDVGDSTTLEFTLDPPNATDQTASWSSSNANVAAVDENGRITAVSGGRATITARAGDGSAKCEVTVLVPVSTITLNKDSLILSLASGTGVNPSEVLRATIEPSNATNKTVLWSSDNPQVISVDASGKVTAFKEGTAVVTATAGNKSASCAVSAVIPATGVLLNQERLSLLLGRSETLTASVMPSTATDKTVIWTSSNEEIATVDATGKVTATGGGTATITATSGEAASRCTVTVTVPVTEIQLSQSSMTLNVGARMTLIASILPADATDKALVWTSNDPEVASVGTNGQVTAASEGRAIVTATSASGEITASCEVTVVIPVSGIHLDQTRLTIDLNTTETLTATVEPENATSRTVTWTSSNLDVATVDNGQVTGVSGGSATITARSGDSIAYCTVTVTVPVTSIRLSQDDLTLAVGKSELLTATVLPVNASDKTITWISNDPNVASVAMNGKVTAIGGGTAIVTARSGAQSADCTVTVTVPSVSVQLDQTRLSLNVGETGTLIATISPSNVTNSTISWTSSNEDVATVDQNGHISAVNGGAAVITAANGGRIARCTVVVSVPVQDVTLNKEDLSLQVGESEILTATVSPSNASDKTVTWSSSNPQVAVVSRSGKVTAAGGGPAVISATAGGVRADCTVMVLVPATQIRLDRDHMTLELGGSDILTATILPSNTTDRTIAWTTSNPEVADVDANGRVSAEGGGTAIITATSGERSANCVVTVTVPVTDVVLDQTSLSLELNSSDLLIASVYPENATDRLVVWSSSNENAVVVDANGRVTAAGEGTAVITAAVGDRSASCTVLVVIPPEGIRLSQSRLSLHVGARDTLTATILPENATNRTVTWTSATPAIATVDANGRVTAVSGGSAVITARAGDTSASCTVLVIVPVESIRVNQAELLLEVGASGVLTATAGPENATDHSVAWSSSNTRVAVVDQDGRVSAMSGGTATITASAGGFSADCTVTVVVPVSSVRLDQTRLSLAVGESANLTATTEPSNATDRTVTWTSSNTEIAEVDANGKVTAVSGGTVTVSAAAGNWSASCTITVTVPVATIRLNRETLSLNVGGSETLRCTITPSSATNKTIDWSSSDTNVVSVDRNGKVTAFGEGTAIVTARTGTLSTDCTVTVALPITSIRLSETGIFLNVGERETLTATVLPAGAAGRSVTWTTTDPDIAVVDENGQVTAIGGGTATITASAEGRSASCTVTVAVPVSSVRLERATLSLNFGDNETLAVTVSPENATDPTVTWTSSNPQIATVDRTGKVTAAGSGAAVITASAGGHSADCTVTVTIPVTNIRLDRTRLSLNVGAGDVLLATVSPENATSRTVTWISSNEEVAVVDANGRVTAAGQGVAVITASAGGRSASCTAVVTVPVTSVRLDRETVALGPGESTVLAATLTPQNASNQTVTWSSSNPAVATVDRNGKVAAAGQGGTAIITASAGDYSADCTVTVTIPVTSIRLDRTRMSLNVGDNDTLRVTVEPSNTSYETVTWTSGSVTVATVDQNGRVVGLSGGVATISASAGDKIARCTVTVTVPVEQIRLDKERVYLNVGDGDDLSATIIPGDATTKSVVWSSDNPAVAVVDRNGHITAASEGTAIVSASAEEETASCEVIVNPRPPVSIPVTAITLNKNYLTLNAGEYETLSVTVLPDNATDNTVTWSSSNTAVATVDAGGRIHAIDEGTSIIMARAGDKSANCQITVHVIPVTDVTLNQTSLELLAGAEAALNAVVRPVNATDRSVTWTSSNPEIVTVDEDGKVRAISAGTAAITARAGERSATCTVTVTALNIPVTSVLLRETELSLTVGGYETLSATVLPENATDQTVTWSSGNPVVATVDEYGTVRALSEGTTAITARAGGRSATCTVTVNGSGLIPATSVTLNATTLSMTPGQSVVLNATVLPANTTDSVVTWANSQPTVAGMVFSGNAATVRALAAGVTVISAKAGDRTVLCRVTVGGGSGPIAVTSVTLDQSEIYLAAGESQALLASLVPENATSALTWSSSNPAIASVDNNGVVQAVAEGAALITAGAGGKSAICRVYVSAGSGNIEVASVTLDVSELVLKTGASRTLRATIQPANATIQTVSWTSSNESVVSVDADGKLHALEEGRSVVTARAGNQFAICRVTVEAGAAESASIESVTVDGAAVQALLHCEEPDAVAVCTVYSASGKPLKTLSQTVSASQTEYAFEMGTSDFAYAKVFLLDASYRPLCEGVRSAD